MANGEKKGSVASRVREIVAPTAEEQGLRLWDVEYVKEGADMYLRITIDRDEGITIDDCERFHRAIDPILDEADPIEGPYILEVSSPGVERTLTRPEHFEAMRGEEVEVRLFAAMDGKKSFTGTLGGYSDGAFEVDCGDAVRRFETSAVSKVSTVFRWQ